MNFIIKSLILLMLCFITIVLFGQPSLSGNVSTNLPLNNVPVSDKLEFNFKINRKVPIDYAEPHNPNVIEIFATLTNGKKTITVNAFYDEEVEETGNCSGSVIQGEIYPRTKFTYKNSNNRLAAQRWVIRHAFRLDEIGMWNFVIKAKDNINPGAGVFKDLFSGSINVVSNPGSKGFIGLKEGRKSFLYHENGDMCFMIGMTEHFSNNSENYICRMRDVIDKVNANNANMLKLWIDTNPEWFFTPVIHGVAGKSGSDAEYHTTVFNSKNAKMIDIYLDYAKLKQVNIQMVMFDPLNLNDLNYWEGWRRYCPFNLNHDSTYPSSIDNTKYYNAPNKSQLITNPWDFFPPIPKPPFVYEILDYQKFYFRYCTSRWGYATNLVAWEIGKEINISTPELKTGKQTLDLDKNGIADTLSNGKTIYIYDNIFKQPSDMVSRFSKWLEESKNIVEITDAGNHLITTSTIDPFIRGGISSPYKKYPLSLEQYNFFSNLDISISGHYFPDPICSNSDDCKKSREKEESLFNAAQIYIDQLKKPHHLQEWGQGDDECSGVSRTWHQDIDPFGIDLHNVTLSSAFTGDFGCALSFNAFFSIQPLQQYHQYKGIGNFMKQFKDLGNVVRSNFIRTNTNYEIINGCKIDKNSEGLRIAYMITVDNSNTINILGWCQDKKFSLTKLYWHYRDYLLTLNPTSRPPNTLRNSFEIEVFNNSLVKVEWFETVDGNHLTASDIFLKPVLKNNKYILTIDFPQELHNSAYADAFFIIKPECKDAVECTENKLFVFPNPTNEKIRITNYIDGFFTYENIHLTNSFGQVIHSVDKASSQTYFDLSNLAAGVYYIRLVSDGQIQTFKIIKE
jgi:hypothetical protein